MVIKSKNFKPDCLPPVESTDLLFYLVLEMSFYIQQQFKAFRSLEAYNQMVSGFITSLKGHIIANKFVVLAKVRHSQRMNDSFIPIWIITPEGDFIVHPSPVKKIPAPTEAEIKNFYKELRGVDKNKWKICLHAS